MEGCGTISAARACLACYSVAVQANAMILAFLAGAGSALGFVYWLFRDERI